MSSPTMSLPPAVFSANPHIGPNQPRSTNFTDSPHFRIYDSPTESGATVALSVLEASYSCFVEDLGWRSSGLSFLDSASDAGPWTKTNIFSDPNLPFVGGRAKMAYEYGLGYIEVHPSYLHGDEAKTAALLPHELSHLLHFSERAAVGGGIEAWYEAMGNYFQDLYKTNPLCEPARQKHGRNAVDMQFNLKKNIEESYRVIVDATMDADGFTVGSPANFYFAWPFLTYLTNNPDNFTGLGPNVVRDLVRKHGRQPDETPLHTLARVVPGPPVGAIVSRYWARMAYVDIGHPTGMAQFLGARDVLDFGNYDHVSAGLWRVKKGRAPRYMGANITPLKKDGDVTIDVMVRASTDDLRAMVSVRNEISGTVRYESLIDGHGTVDIAAYEEATLVVVRAPAKLLVYNPFQLETDGEANDGWGYTVEVKGAQF
ncbi:hypothetical protein OQA88_8983 [Cercophora sp. LCS_1]